MKIMRAMPKLMMAGEGTRLNVLGDHQCIKLTGKDTDNQYTLIEQTNEPGTGIPRHVHTREDEVFHVLEGAVEFEVDAEVKTLQAGELAYVPRGTTHSFRVVGTTKAKVLLSVFPAGLEDMFQELAQLTAGPPDFAVVAEICGRYGITFV
ncbi:cupin domain-containing protein [Hymenobacter jejuensis]|nr:cupin domain-containing protein [Hymenobacter jejuensis]